MENKGQTYWDQKYEQGLPSLTKPDPFFLHAYARCFSADSYNSSSALDIAGGLGRHALFLTQKGWKVRVIDISTVAIDALRKTADQLGASLDLAAGNAAEEPLGDNSLDLIVLFYHLDRTLFPNITVALRQGGILICKMRIRWHCGEQPQEDFLLDLDELLKLLPGLTIVEHHQRQLNNQTRGVVEYIGQKP